MSTRFPFGELPDYPGPLTKGMRGDNVKLFQELLTLLGFTVDIDGEFDAATRNALRSMTGAEMLTETAWGILTASFSHALREIPAKHNLQLTALAYAKRHMKSGARELNKNEGPWVRLYTGGQDGAEIYWCAGFISFCIAQARNTLDPAPEDLYTGIPYTLSCDELGNWGRENNLLITDPEHPMIQPGSLFLEGSVDYDPDTNPVYSHTGFVDEFYGDSFTSVEGNFNDKVFAKYRAFGTRVIHFIDPSAAGSSV
jgi:Putative peptidoglycan binding domain